jgi:hypothetical protein
MYVCIGNILRWMKLTLTVQTCYPGEVHGLGRAWLQIHGTSLRYPLQTETKTDLRQIDFNFGIVDISSGMKRVENSKEAFRNLTLIADDGVSEYSSVVLTPSHW